MTRVVVEAKLNVSENVNYAMKNDLRRYFCAAGAFAHNKVESLQGNWVPANSRSVSLRTL